MKLFLEKYTQLKQFFDTLISFEIFTVLFGKLEITFVLCYYVCK